MVKMKSWCVILLLLYNFSGVLSRSFKVGGDRAFTVDQLDSKCSHDGIMLVNIIALKREGNKILANATLRVSEDIIMDPIQNVEINRCRNKENLDTCEYFFHIKYDSLCKALDSPALAILYKTCVPPARCPLKKGTYQVTNAEMDMTTVLLVPTERWYWLSKLRTSEKATNRTLSCSTFGFYFSPNS